MTLKSAAQRKFLRSNYEEYLYCIMKIIRFEYKKKIYWGIVEQDVVTALQEPPFEKIMPTKNSISLSKVRLLVPTIARTIVLVGLNYRDHAKELGMKIPREPIIFLKPTTTLVPHGADIIYPKSVERLDYEAELAFVVKKKARNILEKDAAKYILGYTCLNDVTARDLQKKDGQWTRAKSFDTFCPVGPWIDTSFNPDDTQIVAMLNGRLKQKSSTVNFIFSVRRILSFISQVMTLHPGDIISTGTPPGVGKMRPGDIIEIQINGIGTLRNKVRQGK